MRTTITLDPDVAAIAGRLKKEGNLPFKEIINRALRDGLARMDAAPERTRYRTKPFDLGDCLLPGVDSVSEMLAIAEGDDYK